jgi:CRISPR-associated protein Csm2
MSDNLVQDVIDDLPSILDGDQEKLVEQAENLGKALSKGRLSTSQIRNIFYEVKRMKYEQKHELYLLRPKLAYIAGRHGHRTREGMVGGIVQLQMIMDNAIIQVLKSENEKCLDQFKDFFEAVLAYHKYYGGAD